MNISKLREDILKGMKLSSDKLKASKKMLGNKIVVSENGEIKIIDPKNI